MATHMKPPGQLPKRIKPVTLPRSVKQIGRNERCPCGSGKKFKDCHEAEGDAFLQRLAHAEQEKLAKQRRAELKAQGVPWYKRLFV